MQIYNLELNDDKISEDKIGYIPLSRKIFNEDDIFWNEKREFSKFEAWVDLIQTARYLPKPTEKMIDNKLCHWSRGQLIASYRFLAKRWNWKSLTKVKRFLELLENLEKIVTDIEQKLTRITICNYDRYNPLKDIKETAREQQENTERTAREQNSNKDNKEIKEIKIVGDREIIIKDYFLNLLPVDSKQPFIESWVSWVDFRKEIKHKLTKSTALKQIDFLLKQPNPIEVINQSIKNGWQGLFELKGGKKDGTNHEYVEPTTSKYNYK